MTQVDSPRSIPGWTHDELSKLFRHHHSGFFTARGMAVVTGLLGVATLSAGRYGISILFASQSLLMTMVSVWHYAHTSLLNRLRFPGRRVG